MLIILESCDFEGCEVTLGAPVSHQVRDFLFRVYALLQKGLVIGIGGSYHIFVVASDAAVEEEVVGSAKFVLVFLNSLIVRVPFPLFVLLGFLRCLLLLICYYLSFTLADLSFFDDSIIFIRVFFLIFIITVSFADSGSL